MWFKIKIFSHPAITDSRYYGHQIAVPRVSAITGVDCINIERFLTNSGMPL